MSVGPDKYVFVKLEVLPGFYGLPGLEELSHITKTNYCKISAVRQDLVDSVTRVLMLEDLHFVRPHFNIMT